MTIGQHEAVGWLDIPMNHAQLMGSKEAMPFDMKRMVYGGFKTLVEA